MAATFIGAAETNLRRGRPAGFAPEAIVLHRSSGSRDVFRARVHDPSSFVSAHYLVGRDGTVLQYVLEEDTAFHAGLVVAPTWTHLRPRANPNFYTIGVELEGTDGDDWPAAQIDATATLLADVARRWNILLDPDHVVPHSLLRAPARCPGATCPIDTMLSRARQRGLGLEAPAESTVRIVTNANLRDGLPSTRAGIVRLLAAGTEVPVTGFVDAGERVQDNACWYRIEEGHFFWAGATTVPQPTGRTSRPASGDSGSTDGMEDGSRLPTLPPIPPRLPVAVDRTTMRLQAKEFRPEVTRKDMVVLHFTAGRSARSAFDTWRKDPQRIATAYLVDVDGTIYETFPPECWAAHLGVKGANNVPDRRSIGIEIANAGPLQPSAGNAAILNWWPPAVANGPQFGTRFCTLEEADKYVSVPFRGKPHFAAYPEGQLEAVATLVRSLCEQFSIPATLPSLAHRFDCDLQAFGSYKGVCTHANFRNDKWDIGPAFPWERLGL